MENDRQKISERVDLKKIAVALAVVIVGVIIYSVVILISRVGKVSVEVAYAPFAARVTLDGVEMRNNAKNYITPGVYRLIVEFDNFNSVEQEIEVFDSTKYIYGQLEASNEVGEEYAKEHVDDFLAVESIAGILAGEADEERLERFPLTAELPFRDPYYTISYNVEDIDSPYLIIISSLAYRQVAVAKVLELLGDEGVGVYDVRVADEENPYAGKFLDNSETNPEEFLKTGFANTGLDFTVGGGIEEGEYFYAYLRYYYQTYIGVVYRTVLKRDGKKWELVAGPASILTTANAPGVPVEILNEVNSL